MSVTGLNGGRIVRQKKCRLRDSEAIEERSRTFYQKFCEGTEVPHLAQQFGYSESYIYRMFKRLPYRIKVEIKNDAIRQKRERLRLTGEAIDAGAVR
jgi:AraC-like DNA-binding protein